MKTNTLYLSNTLNTANTNVTFRAVWHLPAQQAQTTTWLLDMK